MNIPTFKYVQVKVFSSFCNFCGTMDKMEYKTIQIIKVLFYFVKEYNAEKLLY